MNGPKNIFHCHISKSHFWFISWVLSYRMLSAESLNEILLLSVSIQFLLILEVIADRLTSPSRICTSITEAWDIAISSPFPRNFCDKFLHAVEVRSFYRHQIPPPADSDVNKSHHLPHLSIKKNTEFKIVSLSQIMLSDTITTMLFFYHV